MTLSEPNTILSGEGIASEPRSDAQRRANGCSPCPDAPSLGEHDWHGAFCSACGADEASSFADSPCPGFEAADVSWHAQEVAGAEDLAGVYSDADTGL